MAFDLDIVLKPEQFALVLQTKLQTRVVKYEH